ncbi:Uncharacterised protein [Burkholderia pseudomallei]|nr:Uncharacterised protein [Burkholderia pseudomallei]CAJ2997655.1 Uncharacterised protein [Burkholderia pseudomallei]CAJ3360563.1 Uncharacterised protein [Burkholderia pseudomallei]CAJ3729626.1 Uncharacterised protein [Burkholderia pseudomallei]CAJ4240000.1 Uncharacterised protein [Burkholderia pseudomallei]
MLMSESIADCVDLFRDARKYDRQTQGNSYRQLATEITRLPYKLGNLSFAGHTKIEI